MITQKFESQVALDFSSKTFEEEFRIHQKNINTLLTQSTDKGNKICRLIDETRSQLLRNHQNSLLQTIKQQEQKNERNISLEAIRNEGNQALAIKGRERCSTGKGKTKGAGNDVLKKMEKKKTRTRSELGKGPTSRTTSPFGGACWARVKDHVTRGRQMSSGRNNKSCCCQIPNYGVGLRAIFFAERKEHSLSPGRTPADEN